MMKSRNLGRGGIDGKIFDLFRQGSDCAFEIPDCGFLAPQSLILTTSQIRLDGRDLAPQLSHNLLL
jgi:hypothetical protein